MRSTKAWRSVASVACSVKNGDLSLHPVEIKDVTEKVFLVVVWEVVVFLPA